MTGDLPPVPGEGPTTSQPSSGIWPPTYFTPAPPRARIWPAITLAAIATILAVIGLIVALAKSMSEPVRPTLPTYTAAETAAAHQKLCDTYKLAARAVQIETNGTNQAFAGIATVNGAVMLEEAANAASALPPNERAAAIALAEAYSNVAAMSSLAGGQDPAWQSALNDANAKDAVMKKVCGG